MMGSLLSWLVHHEEVHLARIGVDHHLDRVAHVVERRVETAVAGKPVGVGVLGVRIVVGGRIGVEHPVHLLVEHHGVGIRVELQERGGLLGHLDDVAVVDHLRRRLDLAGQEKVEVAEAQGEGTPAHQAPGAHSPTTRVTVGDLLAGVGVLVVQLGSLRVRDDEARRVRALPVVDLRAGLVKGGLARRRQAGKTEVQGCRPR